VFAVALTPDGGYAITASEDKTLRVWDVESGHAVHTLFGHAGRVFAVALTPDGGYAITASEDKTLRVWDVESGQAVHTLSGHADWVTAVAVTPDGRCAVSASWDRTLRVWDLGSGLNVARFDADAPFGYRAVACEESGLTVVAGDGLGRIHHLSLEGVEACAALPAAQGAPDTVPPRTTQPST
jgi:WD40 repeat protein